MKKDKGPHVFYPFGFKGKKFLGEKTEEIECAFCKKKYSVEIIESYEMPGRAHVKGPSKCPHCDMFFWYRDFLERE